MHAELVDDLEPITEQWLRTWAKRDPHVWSVPGTNLFIAKHRSPLRCNLWSISMETEDGDEIDFCYVEQRGALRSMLDLFATAASAAQESQYDPAQLIELVSREG